MSPEAEDVDAFRAQVTRLEAELHVAKSQLAVSEAKVRQVSSNGTLLGQTPISLPLGPSIHNLLLLADSALPLGSFAYSNGLESFLAHHKPLPAGSTQISIYKFTRLHHCTICPGRVSGPA
jgi:urease accessory protein